jgi:hypothetical protein
LIGLRVCEFGYPVVASLFVILCSLAGWSIAVPRRKSNYTNFNLVCQGDLALLFEQFRPFLARVSGFSGHFSRRKGYFTKS